jgi:chromosome segregation ATPase
MTEIDILDREIRWQDDLCVAEWIDDAKAEIQQLRDHHGRLSKMLTEAAQIIDDQNEEIGELKTQISFERVQQQAEVNQLNDDIKFLRSKLPNL